MEPNRQAACFNEWMRRYTDEPDTFNREWQTVSEFLAEKNNGIVPSYGATCVAYLAEIDQTLAA